MNANNTCFKAFKAKYYSFRPSLSLWALMVEQAAHLPCPHLFPPPPPPAGTASHSLWALMVEQAAQSLEALLGPLLEALCYEGAGGGGPAEAGRQLALRSLPPPPFSAAQCCELLARHPVMRDRLPVTIHKRGEATAKVGGGGRGLGSRVWGERLRPRCVCVGGGEVHELQPGRGEKKGGLIKFGMEPAIIQVRGSHGR